MACKINFQTPGSRGGNKKPQSEFKNLYHLYQYFRYTFSQII